MPSFWLVKTEPSSYCWDDLEAEGQTAWDGVRNPEAKNNLARMKEGDGVLFYHSGEERQVVGVARVVREAYPDPTDETGKWLAVDIAMFTPLAAPVTLEDIKRDPALLGMVILKQGRLSVAPVTDKEFQRVLERGGLGISPRWH